ncbi:MAG: hypothetical protein M3140_05185 [Actinomycetota bacterium]|nr:hypothetical protein [Actinomycetota bacterium]
MKITGSAALATTAAVVLLLTACSGAHGDRPANRAGDASRVSAADSSSPPATTPTTASTLTPRSTLTPTLTRTPTQAPRTTRAKPTRAKAGRPAVIKPVRRPRSRVAQLPHGGRTLLPTYRVVAYYGVPHNRALGILGAGSPEHAAQAIERVSAGYTRFGRPVQPAMEVVATVAQGSPGRDGSYSAPIPTSDVTEYLKVAKAHKMLLVLDFQPGRGEFLPQVKQFAKFLRDPWVGVALDPEWKISPGELPGREIGHSRAASINAVSAYLAALVQRENLPQKLFVVHQFTLRMLPDRAAITRHRQLALVLHADGHGSVAAKREVYRRLAFPRSVGAGFKLFYREDGQLMTPAEVMALPRRPDLITYQ